MTQRNMQLIIRQQRLIAEADQIRSSGFTNPQARWLLASVLARLAQLETELSGKATNHCNHDHEHAYLPF